MTNLIPTRNHPHNLDPTACVVSIDHETHSFVARVRAGFVAIVGGTGCALADTYSTKAGAINALREHHTGGKIAA